MATINGKPLSAKEFIWFYKKNHQNDANAYKDLETYLNQYINFKLKVLDAKDMHLDTDTAYLNEIKNYDIALRAQKHVAKTNAMYNMILNEYKDAALMFNVSEMKVWNKAQSDENLLRAFYDKNKNTYTSTFEDIKTQVMNDYEQYLENEWVQALRKKYTVKVNLPEVRKLVKL
ncbi:hypothetical protein [Pedobacter sp. MC2016-24]|uniref:hypothetical protein n=1 Tax=Pedobacter sp. MC2016-24 TaxID=2780090 RepID=UPI00351C0217